MPPLSDLAVLLGILVATVWWIVRLRRRGLRGGRLAAASGMAFLGLVLVVTMVAHSIDVLSRLLIGTGYDGAAFAYGFRTYSLLLLGAVLIACGTWLLRLSLLVAASPLDGRRRAVLAVLTVLALVIPLVPIQGFFAIPLSAIAAVALLLVLWQLRPLRAPAAPGLSAAKPAPE